MTDVAVSTPDGSLAGYLARPEGEPPWPGVVVIHDALGMTRDVRSQADWLAGHGYLAVAPDLFHPGGHRVSLRTLARSMGSGGGPVHDGAGATGGWLAERPECSGRIGVIGFCMGGGFALALAAGHGFSASSVNYGRLPKDPAVALRAGCPIVGSFGGRDRTLRGAAARLERVLEELGIDHDIKEYPQAGHAFLNDHRGERPSGLMARMMPLTGWMIGGTGYRDASAQDARRRIVAFFDRHLKPAPGPSGS